MWNPMRYTVTCTLDLLSPMSTDEKNQKIEMIRPTWNGCKPDRMCNRVVWAENSTEHASLRMAYLVPATSIRIENGYS